MPDRPTPFDLVFGDVAEDRFPQIREGLGDAALPFDRDALLMLRPMVELLRDLRPEEGVGEGMEEMVALVHLAFLFWHFGGRTVSCGEDSLNVAVKEDSHRVVDPTRSETAYYLQLPLHRMWGSPIVGEAAEPLDGWFVGRDGDRLSVVAVFGMHQQRSGFSVVETAGPPPDDVLRPDGSPLFAPALAGGEAAGLLSITGMDELLELAWRLDSVLADRISGDDGVQIA